MTIAVTAVTGQLGSAIAEALIAMNTGETIIFRPFIEKM